VWYLMARLELRQAFRSTWPTASSATTPAAAMVILLSLSSFLLMARNLFKASRPKTPLTNAWGSAVVWSENEKASLCGGGSTTQEGARFRQAHNRHLYGLVLCGFFHLSPYPPQQKKPPKCVETLHGCSLAPEAETCRTLRFGGGRPLRENRRRNTKEVGTRPTRENMNKIPHTHTHTHTHTNTHSQDALT